MKKMIFGAVSAALVLSMAVTGAFAAGHGTDRRQYFADVDGDGVCDNRGTSHGQYFVDADGDGVCDNYGTGRGQYFVDVDGDGVCDNYGTGRGCGQGQGRNCRR